MATFITVVNSAVKLIEFKITEYISTGNKTYDQLMNTFALTALSVFVAWMTQYNYYNELKKFISEKWTKPPVAKVEKPPTGKIILTDEKITQFNDYVSKNFASSKDCLLSTETPLEIQFTNMILDMFMSIHSKSSNMTCTSKYCFETKKVLKNSINANCNLNKHVVVMYMKDNFTYPIYASDKGLICLVKNSIVKDIVIRYENEAVLAEFFEQSPAEYSTILFKESYSKQKIVDLDKTLLSEVFPDRDMSKFISRHKPMLVRRLDSFIAANKNQIEFNGFGSYNLGIMLQGSPGSGKTLLMKVIANYLRRDVMVIDMTKINTRQKFVEVFKSHKSFIYVLDEFDCVQGAISDRTSANGETSGKDSDSKTIALKQAHRDAYIKLMNATEKLAQRKNKKPTPVAENKTQDEFEEEDVVSEGYVALLKEEADNLKKTLVEHENRLTLDTILITLDGMEEMRGRVIIAATNHIKNIDPALLRAGRFDLKLFLDKFNEEETKQLLTAMFTNIASEEDFAKMHNTKLYSDKYTPVQITNMALGIGNLDKLIDELTYTEEEKEN